MDGAGSSKAGQIPKRKPSTGTETAPPLKYSKMSGFATTAGQEFEMHLCALVFLRARSSGLEFQLGSNVKGAGALDDLVFRCKTQQAPSVWQTMYVQLKHKDNSWVASKMLKSDSGRFSLPRYFKSYLEIKKTMALKKETLLDGSFENSQFVIFTNAKGKGDLGESFSGDLSSLEKFVRFGSGSVFCFEKDKEMLKCLGECSHDGRQFLGRFRLFCDQPNVNKLKAAVKEELLKLDPETIRGLKIDRLCDCYLSNVKVWWARESEILDNDHNILLRAVDKVRLELCSEQTMTAYSLELEFEEASLPLLGAGLSFVQCSAGSCRLSLTKLVQASPGRCLVLACQQLPHNRRALLAEWRKGDVKRLVVCTQDWCSELADPCFEVIKQMLDIRDKSSVRDIVFLQDGISSVGSDLTRVFQGKCQSSSDEFEILQLTKGSRDQIFDRAVNLQGYETTLRQLLGNDRASASQVLDASLVAAIMESAGPLTVGSALPEGIGYFVERTLEWACVKASVFHDLQGTVTIRVTQREDSARALLERAMDIVCLLKDYPPFSQGNMEDITIKLNQSQLVPDNNDGAVCVGPKFPLGVYECNCVGLRFGQNNAVTALHVCPSKDASGKASFLFVSNQTNEDDARKLSDFHKSQHFLSLKDGQLRWIQSHRDVEFVRPHFDKDQVQGLKPEKAIDVEDRLVLVCAEPGMGKSTLMARLAKNTKAALPHYFVILLALNDHTELFARGEHKDALGFLSSASKVDSPLQRSLIKHALEVSGNVIVIADGFDEIAPKYFEECCQLLSSLVETNASRLWMTSRNSIKQTLEARFSKFSAKLRNFDKEAQRDFLKKFWAGKSWLKEAELDEFIDQLLVKTSHAIRDKDNNFMGIPLQTQMLAEVYEDHVTCSAVKSELPVNLNVLSLLEKFIEKKFRLYVEVKLLLQPHTATYETSYEMYEKTFMDCHSAAALSLILGEDNLKTLGMGWVIRESSDFCKAISCGKDKTGFIVDVVNGKPHFLHRVFAEYFVAKWISESLADNTELIRSKLFTADFGVVRTIVDRILSLNVPLHTAVLSEDPEQVRTLLERRVELVEARDGGGRTALHLAAGLGSSEDREENIRRDEILDLLISKTSNFHLIDDVLGGSPLRYADITQWWTAVNKLLRKCDNNEQFLLTSANVTHKGMLKTIFDLDLDRLLGFCLDHGLAVRLKAKGQLLLRACEEGSLNVASLLIDRNADINHFSGDCRPPLILASRGGHLGIVKLLYLELAKSSHFDSNTSATNTSNSSKFTNMKDKVGNTALHHAARFGHSDVVSFLISQGGDFKSRNQDERTPLHLAAVHNHPSALRVLLEAAEDSCDDDRDSVLDIATRVGYLECVNLLVQAGAKLSRVGRSGRTPLMAAARRGYQEIVECMLHNFNTEREGISQLDFINMKDKNDKAAMHHAAEFGLSDVMSFLISWGGDSKSRNQDERTPLHFAAESKDPRAVRVLLENLNDADRADAVNSCDGDGDGVLHHAARGGSVECVAMLVQAGSKLSLGGSDGETPLMAAASEGKQEVVEYLLRNFNAEREGMSQLDFMNTKDKDGLTAFDKADSDCRDLIARVLQGLTGQP